LPGNPPDTPHRHPRSMAAYCDRGKARRAEIRRSAVDHRPRARFSARTCLALP
jgi:hypothetical protein